jgi:hypothetical protein
VLRQIPVLRECEQCGRVDFTAAVCVIVVWVSGLAEAVAIVPCLETRVCGTGKCGAPHRVVSREFGAHPSTRGVVGDWTRALLIFEDGECISLRNAAARKLACA